MLSAIVGACEDNMDRFDDDKDDDDER